LSGRVYLASSVQPRKLREPAGQPDLLVERQSGTVDLPGQPVGAPLRTTSCGAGSGSRRTRRPTGGCCATARLDVRQRRLASAGVTAYVAREDLARPFAPRGQEPARLFSLAAEALGRCSEPVREHWLQGLSTLSDATVNDILDAISGLSDLVHRFTVALLQCTSRRISDVCTM